MRAPPASSTLLLLSTLIGACESENVSSTLDLTSSSQAADVHEFPAPMEGVEKVTSALTTSNWVGQFSGLDTTEPFAFPVNVGGTWEMVNSFNPGSLGNPLHNQFDYACKRDPNTFFTWIFNVADNNAFGDTSGFFQTSATNQYKAYVTSISANQSVIRYYRSPDPCPAVGTTPTWLYGTIGVPSFINGTLDYPYSFYDDINNRMWITFDGSLTTSPQVTSLGIILLNADGTANYWQNNCDTHMNQLANGVVDSAGDVHVIYLDNDMQKVRTITFRGTTHSWDCATAANVGTHKFNQARCMAQCGAPIPIVPGIGQNCLQDSHASSIAIDRTFGTDTMVAMFSTTNDGVPNQVVTKFFRSTDLGIHWTAIAQTAATSVKQRVTAAFTPTIGSIPGLFTAQSTYNISGSQLAQVLWFSQDGGQTWAGEYASPARSVHAYGLCYWGDYDGAVGDLAHGNVNTNQNVSYFNFAQSGDNFGFWGIQAYTGP